MSKPKSKTSSKPSRTAFPTGAGGAALRPAFPWASAGLAALLVLATVAAYLPALSAGFIWDDDQYVTRNRTLRDLAGLGQIWFKVGAVPQYYPLVHTTFWLEYHLWGLNAPGYHLVNILLHAAAAILLWRVLIKLQLPGAWLAAAIFVLHPVHVESVAWITERKNVLSAVCYFAAALAYLRYVESKDTGVSGRRPGVFYFGALLLFLAALWSKTVTCSLPAALLLARWWKQGRLRWSDVGPLLPFFAIGAGLGMLTAWMEKHTVGAVGAAWTLNFFERCLIAGRALWFYASKLVWPTDLTFIYPRWEISTTAWWQWLFPLAALAVVAALWSVRNRIGRGPLVAVLIFAGTLFPALGFVDVYPFRYSYVADHFQYLASVALITLFAVGLSRLPRVVTLGLPVVLGVLVWKQAHVYRNLETLWRDTLAKNPASAIAHNNLGALLSAQGKFAEAGTHYREALRLEPDDEETLSNLGVVLSEQGKSEQAMELLRKALQINPNNAEVQCNLGKVLAERKQYDEAIASFQTAIRLLPQRAEFYHNLGSVLASRGRMAEAIGQFRQALERRPDYPDAHNNLGLVLAGQSKYSEAIEHFTAALKINPNYSNAHFNLGQALVAQQKFDEAVAHYREALRLRPDYLEARNRLAFLFMAHGRLEDAVNHYQESLRLNPQQPETRFNLGNALALQKKYVEAVGQYDETLRLVPDHAPAHKNLGLALARLGRREEAVKHLTEALRLKPDYEEARQQLRALDEKPSSDPDSPK